MAAPYLLLLLPALALARIDVDLAGTFGPNKSNMKVYLSGNDIGIISDQERSTFRVSDRDLKDAVGAYYGARPGSAYLHSPTPYGDLYQTYGWTQVTRTLTPKRGTILGISSQRTVIMKQVFENNSNYPASINVGISKEVQNTAASSWSTGGSLTVGQEISYEFDIEVAEGGGTTSFSYKSAWGKNTKKSQTVTVGSLKGMEMVLQPGQAVISKLEATRGTIRVQVEYDASLSGATAVCYGWRHRGHYFWSLDIGAVMKSGGISNSVTSREVIEFRFYTNSTVTVHNK